MTDKPRIFRSKDFEEVIDKGFDDYRKEHNMQKQEFIQKMIDIFQTETEYYKGTYCCEYGIDYYERFEAVLHFLKDLDDNPNNSLESIWARRIMTRYNRFMNDWDGYSIEEPLFPTPQMMFGILVGFAQEAI